ncbi:Type 4 prepilin-like proteins leader peptide-processing enzyme [Achromobacter anxifer]|uniref:Prepilin leader peptidase/N-methyltransferase n=1 Tax=Achromobacter anxifer TaxID=1287737 RepID=A0A6S7F3B0_9BURK|nr:A24 family peptidase [Achromobacter anxifer]CAB3928268.1 Type 4 prepilin-like proteins leader peptide-processing enzyme [Achromobacter anxifer]
MRHVFDLPLGVFIGLAALAGLFVGNWLTLLTHRLPRMMEQEWQAHCQDAAGKPRPANRYGLWSPRSYCPACDAPVTGWRRLPLLGWLMLRGRCGACGAAIGWRYPAIELLTCALFVVCAWRFGATPLALSAMGLSAMLVALAWIDFESTLLPDVLTQPLLWAGLLVNLFDAYTSVHMAVAGAAAGYVFLWVIFHVFRLLTGREGMGYGDFKLLAALGAWFGLEALPTLLLSASLLGVLIGGALTLSGRASRGQPLPFGPYLALAGVVTLLVGGEQGLGQFLQ